ncbi:MAG: hypothetical protein ACXWJW_10445 [Xanthobacteraceae bacterium]
MRFRSYCSTTMFYGVVGVTYFTMSAGFAGDLDKRSMMAAAPPFGAVDGVNGKAEFLGGSLGNRSLFAGFGAASFPMDKIGVLNNQYGVQIDTGVGTFDSRSFGNLAAHVFWRDPGRGLIGIYTSHTWWNQFDGVYIGQVAAEGEYFMGRWTVQGIAGIEFGNSASNTITNTSVVPPLGGGGAPAGVFTVGTFTETFDIRTRFFDQINLKYYVTDNWNAFVGHRYLGGKNALALGTEYALPLNNGMMASGFVEGRVGEDNNHGVWGGIRFYFGNAPKTLMARQRQDDPPLWSMDSLLSIINNLKTTPSTSNTLFCNNGDTLQNNGTCESGGS